MSSCDKFGNGDMRKETQLYQSFLHPSASQPLQYCTKNIFNEVPLVLLKQ